MQHPSHDLQSRKVTLHHTSDFDIDNNMRDMTGEDWIDMSIFETTATLDIGSMDSGVIVDYDNDKGSLGSVTTNIFISNNMPDGDERSNTKNTVNGFATASNLTGTTTNNNNGPVSPSGGAASPQGDSAMGEPELPPSADVDVVGADV